MGKEESVSFGDSGLIHPMVQPLQMCSLLVWFRNAWGADAWLGEHARNN
jgi:hypothetical protein